MNAAADAAQRAFASWKEVSVANRQRVMFKYQQLIRESQQDIAEIITREQGKTLADAEGDVFRGLEVVEHTCSTGTLMQGDTLGNISKDLDIYSVRTPLGVCAGVAPFNFPAMIPLWYYPVAVTCGNTYLLKPSEKVPGASIRLAELAMEAGLPAGVLNIIHGGKETVDFICDNQHVRAISFVGSTDVGEYIHQRGSANGKRVQANLGAKNHAVIMPDANKNTTLNALVGSAFGAAGQRCMALPVAIFVGEAAEWIPELISRAQELVVGPGHESTTAVGPLISPASRQRVVDIVRSSEKMGANCLLDGTEVVVPGYEAGNFVGPTILSNVTTNMPCYSEEIFGPVLSCMSVNDVDDAISLINSNEYGNGTCIFTSSGPAARLFTHSIEAGQVGVNVPIPVPISFFSFTGNKRSIRGDINFFGKGGVQFVTQVKTVMTNWRADDVPHHDRSAGVMPILGRDQ
jgi:malonate-semialdehyde dehydrogenase (acetylating) / methylmalonate-semialdehyde dehydrogenase